MNEEPEKPERWYQFRDRNDRTGGFLRLLLIVSAVALIIIIVAVWPRGEWYGEPGGAFYNSAKEEIRNAITAYSASHNNSFPTLSGNITIGSKTYYVLDFNQLLIVNGGIMKTMPTGLANVSVGNDNCNGADSRCENTSHYVWMVDKAGNIISVCINGSTGGCNAANKDGYQYIWP